MEQILLQLLARLLAREGCQAKVMIVDITVCRLVTEQATF